jgi:hypothetical protein
MIKAMISQMIKAANKPKGFAFVIMQSLFS